MKELSTEEKAKRYDEAIKRAKAMIPVAANQEEIYNSVITIFPELKESEDEKIRQLLIRFVKYDMSDNYSDDFTPADCIAWLEKQGEQKSDTDFSDLRTWKYIVDAVWTEKEGIGQYLDSPFTEEVAKKLQKRFGNIEQKPTEWSEEDDIRFNATVSFLKRYKGIDYENTGVCISWLKSLKDRFTWKPSELQIEALVSAIDVMIDNKGAGDKNTILLSGLYHKLKAL